MKAYQATYILEQFVDSTNRWGAIFGDKAIEFPLSQKDANKIMDSIAGQLSPENLHCDGEAPMAYVRSKLAELTRVQRELETYCLDNWLETPTCDY